MVLGFLSLVFLSQGTSITAHIVFMFARCWCCVRHSQYKGRWYRWVLLLFAGLGIGELAGLGSSLQQRFSIP